MPGPTETRDRLLDAAQRLVLENGFAATTVDAVLAAAESSKGAFFHHFPSKAALGHALVERYAASDAELLDSLMAEAEAQTDDPARQLIAFVAGFERETRVLAHEQPGCLFVSFIYERGLGGAATEETVAQSILLWRTRILDKLQQAVDRQPPPVAIDLPSLADQVFTIFEGAFLLARALDEPEVLPSQLAHLRHYLELLFGGPAPS